MPSEPSSSTARRFASPLPIPASCAGTMTLSNTVRSSSRLKNWKIKPIEARRYFAEPASPSRSTRVPSTVILPLEGLSRPAIRFSSVDFPLPEWPRIATHSPNATDKVTPASAGGPASYFFVASRTSIIGAFAMSANLRTDRYPSRRPADVTVSPGRRPGGVPAYIPGATRRADTIEYDLRMEELLQRLSTPERMNWLKVQAVVLATACFYGL